MGRLSAGEINRHFANDYTEQDADDEYELRFEEPDYERQIEREIDSTEYDWIFDDYWFDDEPYEDRYEDPAPERM